MQFNRGGDIKEKLGVGEFGLMVKEIKKSLFEIIISRSTIWSTHPLPKIADNINWKSIPGSKDNNLHKLIGVVRTKDLGDLKDQVKFTKHNIKGVFKHHSCKLTAINFYTTQKWFYKYQIEKVPNGVLMEIIYSKNPKKCNYSGEDKILRLH